jgi:predicted 3-demethylubiquinone-9 3-methyltransferase (glyoxalase superfamily)
MATITPFLWFDGDAEEALGLYASVFAGSTTLNVSKSEDPGGYFVATLKVGELELTLFDGGPGFTFSEAISLFVSVETREEVDHLWESLSAGGEQGRCGWLKDRFGVSWQIVPTALGRLMGDPDPLRASRVREAMLTMSKLDIATLEAAHHG